MSGTNEEKKASNQLPAEQERILAIVAEASEQALREKAMNNIVYAEISTALSRMSYP